MEEKKYERLMLSNQLCFPLYAAAKEIVRKYKPYLDEIDLTYTQYITMMLMWEHKQMNVRQLGECLYLDSGTLTPVLKKLQEKGFEVDRKLILVQDVKQVGSYTATVKLHKEVSVEIPFEVVAEE
jgi:hypothetical protein